MAKRKIKPRKPPVDDDFSATGADDEQERPVATKPPKAKGKASNDDYFGDDDDEPSESSFLNKGGGEEEDDADADVAPAASAKKNGKKSKLLDGPSSLTTKIPKREIITFEDNRKLTKAAQAKLDIWKGKSRAKALDAFFAGTAERAKKKLGHGSVFIGDESNALVICIPMFGGHEPDAHLHPGCLPMEFVIAQDGFPLGLVWQIVAKFGIGKSGLLAEFGRWFCMAGGGFQLCEAETKFNPFWYQSIMGREYFKRSPLHRCDSTEDWQKHLTFGVHDMKRFMIGDKENPGPGRTFPVLYGVDSIMGKLSEKSQEKILGKLGKDGKRGETGEGHADRGFPLEALIITRYMRTIPAELDNWPFGLVLINHLRIKQDDMGNEERNKAGGEQVNFQESFEIELKKMGGHKKMIECSEWQGYPIGISCEKNSFGPGQRRIVTRLAWCDVEREDGSWEQKSFWDWDWSTVHLLNNILRGEHASPKLRANLKAIGFHLECPSASDVENSAWSKNLGMRANDAMPWREVGAMIRRDPKLMNQLRKALRINRRPVLNGDYVRQLDALSENLP